MIGLFNILKIKCGKKISVNIMDSFMFILKYIYTCISWFICKSLAIILFPFCISLFLILNILPFRFFFPILDDFTIFLTTFRMYAQVSFKFAHILIAHKFFGLLSDIKFYIKDWSGSTLLRLATMLALLILLGGDIHKNPGPLSFCHWNLGGLPTDNFLKKTLLQAFLCVNNFDIVVLGETHLTSKIVNNDLEIEGYSFERCDHPDDDARGGIGIYYKSSLPCIFKPELTKLNETLVFQVKIGTKKCFFTYLYRNPSTENNSTDKVDEFTNELNNTLDNIKGKNPYVNFVIGDFNAKNTVWWGIQLIIQVNPFRILQAYMVSVRLLTNQRIFIPEKIPLALT